MIDQSLSVRRRPSHPLLTLVIASLLWGVDVAAQEETVWYVEYEHYLRTHEGAVHPLEPLKIWFDEQRARQAIDDERYVIINGDSVHSVDIFNSHYESGLESGIDMGWLTNIGLIWQLRRTPSVAFRDEAGRERIASYETRQMDVDFRLTKNMRPMQLQLYVTDEVPISGEALRKLGTIRSLIDVEIAIDFKEIYDTLATRGLLPFSMTILSTQKADTSAVPVYRLKTIKRTTVPKDFFLPPATYTSNAFGDPTEAMLWELRGIPMPGGTKPVR